MKYKVTALQDVTIRAYVRGETPIRLGNQVVMKPTEHEEWVSLRAGQFRDGLGLVIGVHPNSLPDESPTHVKGVPMIIGEGYSSEELPKEFHGLYRLEVSE